MNPKIEELLARIHELERELEADLAETRARFHYHIDGHKIHFEREAAALQRRLRKSSLRTLIDAPLRHILTAPVIYGLFVPLLLLDIAVSLYQGICFPVYGIPRLKRGDYFVFDRARLPYLNAIERLNCLYCEYGNGLLSWAKEVAGRTEQFWCPIKHARRVPTPHESYNRFFDYGDAERYRAELQRLRKAYGEVKEGSDSTVQQRSE
ncbi:hypothetical protein [Methylococcus geothermalis]|uniref:Uncharacterized protein n=1 Tax=Methylococcus geothermalis TaxID=2681310 RepID=A0A858Q630_9GAMM|nr:hypothetical protein [Methylococcus geothermalis]QJD29299.1 hypothetical protein GNH96_04520 [Methylococcus geothermalis]